MSIEEENAQLKELLIASRNLMWGTDNLMGLLDCMDGPYYSNFQPVVTELVNTIDNLIKPS